MLCCNPNTAIKPRLIEMAVSVDVICSGLNAPGANPPIARINHKRATNPAIYPINPYSKTSPRFEAIDEDNDDIVSIAYSCAILLLLVLIRFEFR